MTVLGTLLGRRSLEDPARPLTDASLLDVLGGEPAEAGVAVTVESSSRMLAVYRAHALLGGLIAGLPLHAYQRHRVGGRAARRQVDAPVITDPHPDATPFEVWEYLVVCLIAWGNAYAFKARDGAGRVRELWPLHPARVRVERKSSWRTDANPSGKRFFVYGDDGAETVYTGGPLGDLLHIPGLSYDGVRGVSPIGLARQGISLGLAAERFAARMFGRGALIPGVLETDQQLEKEDAERLQAQWAAKTAGDFGQWRIPVLDKGAKFRPVGLPPADAQYIEVRRFQVVEIARLYGLPPHLLADVERSTSWGSGIEQQNMAMLIFTLDPWLVRIEQRATRELVLSRNTYVKFTRAGLLRADTATRYMAYQRAWTNSWLSADDIRELEDLDPLPDDIGDQYFRPTNLTPVTSQPDPQPDALPETDPEEEDDNAD